MSKFVGLEGYTTDPKVESQTGYTIELTDDISITVLRAGGRNKNFGKVFNRITGPFQRRMQNKTIDDATEDLLFYEIYAEAIVVKWKGFRLIGMDEDMPCTKENVIQMFKDNPNIFKIVRETADTLEYFREKEIQQIVEPLGND